MANSMTGFKPQTQQVGGYTVKPVQQYTPEQMQLFQQLFGQVSPDSYTSRLAGGDESLFAEMEAPALRQFGELQGGMASRFSGMGGLGARKSSGFSNTMNQAASSFAQDLQSRRQELQRNAIRDLMGMSQQLLANEPYQYFSEPTQNKRSFLDKLMGGALPIAGAGIGGFFGGPAGAAIGGQMGSQAAQGFYY